MGHACLRLDSRGGEAIGDLARGLIQPCIGRRATVMDDGGGVGPNGGVVADDVGETCHLEVH